MPVERKSVKISNQQFLNALLYMVENGDHCQKSMRTGMRFTWNLTDGPKNGIIQRIFEELQSQNVIDVQGEILWRQGTVEGFLIEKISFTKKCEFFWFLCLLHNTQNLDSEKNSSVQNFFVRFVFVREMACADTHRGLACRGSLPPKKGGANNENTCRLCAWKVWSKQSPRRTWRQKTHRIAQP